jgi:hypothetical protein
MTKIYLNFFNWVLHTNNSMNDQGGSSIHNPNRIESPETLGDKIYP